MAQIAFTGFWSGTEAEEFIGPAFLEPFSAFGTPAYAVGSKVSGSVSIFQLTDGGLPQPVGVLEQFATFEGYVAGGFTAFETNDSSIWAWDGLTGQTFALDDASDPSLSRVAIQSGQLLTLSSVEPIGDHLAVASTGGDEILLLHNTSQGMRIGDRVADDTKSNVTEVSDLLSLSIDGRDFLISASHSESGLTCFEMIDTGLHHRDHIGNKDGLWSNGISKLATCDINGEHYVIALSGDANSVHCLRINDQGVFFTADSLWDSRATRFEGAQDMDLFEWQGRDFIVVGGQDAGLSLIEILPGGELMHHHSVAQTVDWDIGPITQIESHLIGDQVQIMVTGSQGAGVAHLMLDLQTMGPRVSGTDANDTLRGDALDNLVIGGAGNDRLRGLEGDDVLLAGTGSDAVSGEEGADVFVFEADGLRDKITDFELGIDRIDLSGWGRIYYHGDLTLTQTQFGGQITWGEERLDVYSADGNPIAAGAWGADDFIF